uniref:VCBS repeat-containing protein n=1 Tax=Paramoeba aestuarina TaxID=180227 RepID=A0A7S4NQU5_9EUKA|mmetsp:Transcript_24383/g.37968  ORF Transcript_24383/g.37968 Transcript_24383/m.37968 type:complete len:448 (+) Transcript_24383:54-1397(+)
MVLPLYRDYEERRERRQKQGKMSKCILGLVFLGILLVGPTPSQATPTSTPWTQVGKFTITDPSFVQIFPQEHKGNDALWITTFSGNPLVSGKVFIAENIADQVASNPNDIKYEKIDGSFEWPNLISYVPNGTIVGCPQVIAMVPDGFLVPGKGTGGLYAITTSTNKNGDTLYSKNISLVEQENGWFYHMVEWRDVNLDGRMDIISARAKSDLVSGTFQGELIWLEQPKSNPLGGAWEMEVLAQGPDVLFAIADFDKGDNIFQLYAAQFFSSSLSLYDVLEGDKPRVVSQVEIFPLPSPYDIKIDDLDRDGKLEILCTEHLGGAGGNVTSFTIPPNDYHTPDAYVQTQLMSGYTVTEPGNNQMAPGFVTLMHPDRDGEALPPNMFVAGDGSQSAYYMTHKGDLEYDQELIIDVDGVVGIVASANMGPKGENQFFVPDYDGNYILIYSF